MAGQRHDYIPSREADLLVWAENFIDMAENYKNDLNIPTAEITELKALLNKFKANFEISRGPERTPAIIAGKNTSKKELIAKIRATVGFYLQNPIVTPKMRVEFGLNPKDETKTSIPVPKTRPEFFLKVKDIRIIEIHFQDQGSDTKARPYGLSGAVISFDVLDEPPAEPRFLSRTELATVTPYALKFTEEDRGKTMYAALQWQNKKGKRGPWSEIQSTVIP
jgi:hypothetical protein